MVVPIAHKVNLTHLDEIHGRQGTAGQFLQGDAYPAVARTLMEGFEIGVKLLRFAETVLRAAESHRPNVLADYLYDLAQTYSSFYQNLPVLKSGEGVRESRLRLSDLTARTMRQGLDLLGIETMERI